MQGHSTKATVEVKLNDKADFYAPSFQRFFKDLLQAPISTFFMNEFTFFDQSDRWIESNISAYTEARMAQCSANKLGTGPFLRMLTWAHDKHPPPDFPYTQATSAHSAAVQLYARSGQLPTADLLFARNKLPGKECRLGCHEDESMWHIFVKCAVYQQWRQDAHFQITGSSFFPHGFFNAADQAPFQLHFHLVQASFLGILSLLDVDGFLYCPFYLSLPFWYT